MDFPASVAPFILRGITLFGIDSVYAGQALRQAAWNRLAGSLEPGLLNGIAREIPLAECIPAARTLLAGQMVGRYLVAVNL